MKSTAKAPANIAFIKYWGKANDFLRLPLNDSFSMNLSGAYTVTTVEFSDMLAADSVRLLDGEFSEKEIERVISGLDRIRARAATTRRARVVTNNTFPKGAGSAASASGFAALTVAGFAALGVSLPEKELTTIARQGSGSACRSIPDGFVIWEKGHDNASSYAYSLYPPTYWDIRDILVIVDKRMKKVATTEGMEKVYTSPCLDARLTAVPVRMEAMKDACSRRDFAAFGRVTEEDCLDMHRVMQTQDPPLMYWSDTTLAVMDAVRHMRGDGLPVYFTIDAGPNVHVLCEGKHEHEALGQLKKVPGVVEVIRNKPAKGARIISDHLF